MMSRKGWATSLASPLSPDGRPRFTASQLLLPQPTITESCSQRAPRCRSTSPPLAQRVELRSRAELPLQHLTKMLPTPNTTPAPGYLTGFRAGRKEISGRYPHHLWPPGASLLHLAPRCSSCRWRGVLDRRGRGGFGAEESGVPSLGGDKM
jgi:hypothetical protein